MKKIKSSDTIYALNNQYPEIIDILYDFGFRQIKMPQMIQTAGRLMTLKKGCEIKGFNYEELIEVLFKHGFQVIE
jgi:hypothetical protein